jgi:hypothetical protein
MIGTHLHKSLAIARFCGWSKAQSITSDCSFRLFKAAGKATGKVAAGKANAKASGLQRLWTRLSVRLHNTIDSSLR